MRLLLVIFSVSKDAGHSSICYHKLKILNLEDEEIVPHSIVRLLGILERTSTSICDIAVDEKLVSLVINDSKNVIKSELYDEKFKIFCELQQGSNMLSLSYCGQTLTFTLKYHPNQNDYSVIPLYIICDGHDGKFQAPDSEKNNKESACQRIDLASKLLQCFTAEKLYESGMGRKTFQIKNKCQIFRSKLGYLEARKISEQRTLWGLLGREIMQSEIASEKSKYLGFLSCTIYNSVKYTSDMINHRDLMKITEGHVALGGGGLALFGTACLYTWPEKLENLNEKFCNKNLVDRTKYLDDSCYRGTLGACFSTTLGSVLHELYHSFNLGHTEHGIMGRGFDNIYRFFIWPPNQEIFVGPYSHPKEGRILQKSLSFKNHIEFKEEFEAEKLSERLEQENKKKESIIAKKFEEKDDTFLTRSCAVILCFHKWFNSFTSPKNPCSLTYDSTSRFIKSTLGIRLVEIRRYYDELVLRDWTFERKVLKFSFQIPEDSFCEKSVLFVEDSFGNILKENI